MLEKNSLTDHGTSDNRHYYSSTYLHTCSVVEKNMVLLSDWKNEFKNIWNMAFPLKTPTSDNQIETRCDKFFKELSSGL
jgi:hypothetical protein